MAATQKAVPLEELHATVKFVREETSPFGGSDHQSTVAMHQLAWGHYDYCYKTRRYNGCKV